jgi:predicted branched-subunit amino acid permease
LDADQQKAERREWMLKGARRALAGPMWFMSLGFLGTGSIAHDAEQPLLATLLSSPLVWAGPAQLLYFSALAANTALLAIVVAVFISSARLMLLSMSLLPMLKRERESLPRLLYLSHHIAITSWTEAMVRLPDVPKHARQSYFFGFSHTLMLGSTIAIGVGWVLSGNLPPILAAGLLLIAPLYFSTNIIAGARRPMDWMSIGFGLLLAPFARFVVPAGFELLFIGLVAGSLAYTVQRILNVRRAPSR